MTPITCVFFGRSGSGKGTQARLLIDKLESMKNGRRVVYAETGERFRNFVKGPTYTGGKVLDVMHAGKFLPPFLPIWMWTSLLVDEIKDNTEHLIFDGVARQPEEGPVLDGALQFYGREKPVIILLDVSEKEARARLLKRGRHDDKEEKITERFKAFESGAMPSVRHFQKSPHCSFVSISGERPIETVHADILKALNIK